MSRTSAYSLCGSDTSAPLSVPMLSQLHGLGSEPVDGGIPRRPRLETSELSTIGTCEKRLASPVAETLLTPELNLAGSQQPAGRRRCLGADYLPLIEDLNHQPVGRTVELG